MNFTVDGKKAVKFGVLPSGDYEAFITAAAETKSTGGTLGIGLVLTIRDDVPKQLGGGRKVRHTVWVTDKTEGMVQDFLVSCNFPDGTTFEGIADICEKVKTLSIRAKLGLNRNNADFNEVKSFDKSQVGGFYQGEMEEFASNSSSASSSAGQDDGKPIDISDDDLPF